MDASSRAPAPPPLNIRPARAVSSPVSGTPRSSSSATSSTFSAGDYYASPPTTSAPTSASTASQLLCWGSSRKERGSSSSKISGSSAVGRPPPPPVAPRKVNAHSYCGRHSDEFLFGGRGLSDLWHAVTKK